MPDKKILTTTATITLPPGGSTTLTSDGVTHFHISSDNGTLTITAATKRIPLSTVPPKTRSANRRSRRSRRTTTAAAATTTTITTTTSTTGTSRSERRKHRKNYRKSLREAARRKPQTDAPVTQPLEGETQRMEEEVEEAKQEPDGEVEAKGGDEVQAAYKRGWDEWDEDEDEQMLVAKCGELELA